MDVFEKLEEAIDALENTIIEFPVGAKSHQEDFKSTEDKINDAREILKTLDSRILVLKARIDAEIKNRELKSDYVNDAAKVLEKDVSDTLINERAVRIAYRSKAIQDVVFRNAGSKEIRKKFEYYLTKLYKINENLAKKDAERSKLTKKLQTLKLEFHHKIYDYKEFLKKLELEKDERLQEIDPAVAHKKEKTEKFISKINTMKKLITNLIAANADKLNGDASLVRLLENHSSLVDLDTLKEQNDQSETKSSEDKNSKEY